MIDFLMTNLYALAAFVAGVICGAVVPKLTAWGIKKWRQIRAKRAELAAKWEDRK